MTISEFESTLNEWGQQRVPFLFMVDFELQKPIVVKLADVNSHEILYNINGLTNGSQETYKINASLIRKPISFQEYHQKFETVYRQLHYGDSYLTNLTIKTEVILQTSLKDLFYASQAKYKVLYKDQFLVFSPEIFVQIRGNTIYSYPMKGTIEATLDNAREIILNDKKELAEHVTIVDLIRNDISQIATQVKVTNFRYLDEISTNQKALLQVSSKIEGTLPESSLAALGTILLALLPAGSVSGAPKPKTIEIIRQAEQENRGYYTGVVGIFDGQNFDSGVMIRFIEHVDNKFFYRSGGGITTQSNCEAEYQEAIDKVYVPVTGVH
jgi:para-aminobenzoate synthetase component 1